MRKQTGFTIVELLIVIVVIGILAAITIISYNGIQARAYNTSVIAGARQTISLINQYVAVNGAYPSLGGELCATLDNSCKSNTNGVVNADNTSFMTNLKTVGTPLPSAPAGDVSGRFGILYYNFTNSGYTYNGAVQSIYVYYVLKGSNTNCGLPNIAQDARLTVQNKPSTTGYSWSNSGVTGCYIHIDGPLSS